MGFSASALAVEPLAQLRLRTLSGEPVDTTKTYVPGELEALSASGASDYSGPIEIRGRGNSTWGFPKRPYKFKLPANHGLAGLTADDEWILLANYSDKTLLRNHVALELSRLLGAFYSPHSSFVEISLNGDYLGNYLLVEQMKFSPNRMNLPALKKKDIEGEAVTGSYLLEVSHKCEEKFCFRTTEKLLFNVKSPREPVPEQAAYIQRYVLAAEEALFSENFRDPELGYARYLDVDQFITWYLVNELFRNQDAATYASIFLHKPRSGKLAMGPVWDFDISAGNINYDNNFLTEGWWIQKRAPWFIRLFEDPAFVEKVKARWKVIRGLELERFFMLLDQTSYYLEESQQRNFSRWPILGKYVWPNFVFFGTYRAEVGYLKDWLRARAAWLDSQWSQ